MAKKKSKVAKKPNFGFLKSKKFLILAAASIAILAVAGYGTFARTDQKPPNTSWQIMSNKTLVSQKRIVQSQNFMKLSAQEKKYLTKCKNKSAWTRYGVTVTYNGYKYKSRNYYVYNLTGSNGPCVLTHKRKYERAEKVAAKAPSTSKNTSSSSSSSSKSTPKVQIGKYTVIGGIAKVTRLTSSSVTKNSAKINYGSNCELFNKGYISVGSQRQDIKSKSGSKTFTNLRPNTSYTARVSVTCSVKDSKGVYRYSNSTSHIHLKTKK